MGKCWCDGFTLIQFHVTTAIATSTLIIPGCQYKCPNQLHADIGPMPLMPSHMTLLISGSHLLPLPLFARKVQKYDCGHYPFTFHFLSLHSSCSHVNLCHLSFCKQQITKTSLDSVFIPSWIRKKAGLICCYQFLSFRLWYDVSMVYLKFWNPYSPSYKL